MQIIKTIKIKVRNALKHNRSMGRIKSREEEVCGIQGGREGKGRGKGARILPHTPSCGVCFFLLFMY